MDETWREKPGGRRPAAGPGDRGRWVVPRLDAGAMAVAEWDPPVVGVHPGIGPRPTHPLLIVPGLVLLAAVSILEGYRWLHLLPDGSLLPTGLLFTLVALPATYWLTRYRSTGLTNVLRRVARICSTSVPVLGLAILIGSAAPWAQLLGITSLVLAASALGLAVATEHGDHSPSHRR
jgi:hypothetical protein